VRLAEVRGAFLPGHGAPLPDLDTDWAPSPAFRDALVRAVSSRAAAAAAVAAAAG
jgi:hypothetical protein